MLFPFHPVLAPAIVRVTDHVIAQVSFKFNIAHINLPALLTHQQGDQGCGLACDLQHIYRLRQKIEVDPQHAKLLLTDLGGYRLQS